MRIVEVDDSAVRHAVIGMRGGERPLRLLLVPMAHIAHPEFYAGVRERLAPCDLVITEGIEGDDWRLDVLMQSYRLVVRRRRWRLVRQKTAELLPPGITEIRADATGAEVLADLRSMGLWRYLYVLAVCPLAGLVGALFGPRIYLRDEFGIDAPEPARRVRPPYVPSGNPLEAALRDRRDRVLLAAMDRVIAEHGDEPKTVAVVYGSTHIVEVYLHLVVRHRYQAEQIEWLTAMTRPARARR